MPAVLPFPFVDWPQDIVQFSSPNRPSASHCRRMVCRSARVPFPAAKTLHYVLTSIGLRLDFFPVLLHGDRTLRALSARLHTLKSRQILRASRTRLAMNAPALSLNCIADIRGALSCVHFFCGDLQVEDSSSLWLQIFRAAPHSTRLSNGRTRRSEVAAAAASDSEWTPPSPPPAPPPASPSTSPPASPPVHAAAGNHPSAPSLAAAGRSSHRGDRVRRCVAGSTMADVAASATDAVPSCRREPGVHAEGHPVVARPRRNCRDDYLEACRR